MSTFIIRNKVTKEQWSASSGKNSWRKINHAKAAFSYSQGWLKRDPLLKEFVDKLDKYKSLYFDNQDVYEVVELLSESEDKLNSCVSCWKRNPSYFLHTQKGKNIKTV